MMYANRLGSVPLTTGQSGRDQWIGASAWLRFEPDVWLDGRAQATPQLVPFSAGPVVCPGQNLVLHITSTTLAVMLSRARFNLTSTPSLPPQAPLPMTLNNFGLQWALR